MGDYDGQVVWLVRDDEWDEYWNVSGVYDSLEAVIANNPEGDWQPVEAEHREGAWSNGLKRHDYKTTWSMTIQGMPG